MGTQTEPVCLFCRGKGPFNSVEHIVPVSLGNDKDVLKGVVCDKCQNYFGREIEGPALHKTPFAFWRVHLGINTKKGKLPTVQLNPPKSGLIPAQHPLTDLLGYTAHENGSTSVDIDDPEMVRSIVRGEKNNFKLVLSPWHLIVMGRLLGKMGLEYLALTDVSLVMTSQFNEMRKYVREGTVKSIWPLFWSQPGSLSDLRGELIDHGGHFEQEIECYRYSLGITNADEYLFAFSMGTDLILICLSHRNPDLRFTRVVEGTQLECVWYSDDSW